MNKLATTLLSVTFAVSASAQLISDFSTADGWGDPIPSVSEGRTQFVGGSTDSFTYIFASEFALPGGSGLSWEVTGFTSSLAPTSSSKAVIQFFAYDEINSLIIPLVDLDIPFGVTGFGLTPTTLLIPYTGTPANAYGFFVAGDGAFAFNFTLDKLAIVPEPSTVALALGGAALVGAIFLRRRRAA